MAHQGKCKACKRIHEWEGEKPLRLCRCEKCGARLKPVNFISCIARGHRKPAGTINITDQPQPRPQPPASPEEQKRAAFEALVGWLTRLLSVPRAVARKVRRSESAHRR